MRRSGGHGGGETPGLIPNPVVKPSSADGTARETVWESRTPPEQQPPERARFLRVRHPSRNRALSHSRSLPWSFSACSPGGPSSEAGPCFRPSLCGFPLPLAVLVPGRGVCVVPSPFSAPSVSPRGCRRPAGTLPTPWGVSSPVLSRALLPALRAEASVFPASLPEKANPLPSVSPRGASARPGGSSPPDGSVPQSSPGLFFRPFVSRLRPFRRASRRRPTPLPSAPSTGGMLPATQGVRPAGRLPGRNDPPRAFLRRPFPGLFSRPRVLCLCVSVWGPAVRLWADGPPVWTPLPAR